MYSRLWPCPAERCRVVDHTVLRCGKTRKENIVPSFNGSGTENTRFKAWKAGLWCCHTTCVLLGHECQHLPQHRLLCEFVTFQIEQELASWLFSETYGLAPLCAMMPVLADTANGVEMPTVNRIHGSPRSASFLKSFLSSFVTSMFRVGIGVYRAALRAAVDRTASPPIKVYNQRAI